MRTAADPVLKGVKELFLMVIWGCAPMVMQDYIWKRLAKGSLHDGLAMKK
jgi:hypothetical protein